MAPEIISGQFEKWKNKVPMHHRRSSSLKINLNPSSVSGKNIFSYSFETLERYEACR